MSAADLRESVKSLNEIVARELFILDAREYADASDDIAEWWDTTDTREKWLFNATAALRAIADAGPSEKMVEAAARVMLDETLKQRISQIQGFSNYPNSTRHWIRDSTLRRGDDVIWDGGPSSEEMLAELERIKARIVARSALSAALREMG